MTCRHRAFLKRLAVGGVAAIALAAGMLGTVSAQDAPRTFSDSGYTVVDDSIWGFFSQYGGMATFGEPISREFTFFGKPTQVFQNAALQVQGDGSVQALQLADPSFLSTTEVNGLTVPPVDPAIAFVAPSPDQPNYSARLQVFLLGTVPDSFTGQPVQFLSTYTSEGGPSVWGLPTSAPRVDPNNPSFIYQRFQNGIMFNDASVGTTRPLPLGEYLKSQLTTTSPLLTAAAASNTDLSQAFVPDTQ